MTHILVKYKGVVIGRVKLEPLKEVFDYSKAIKPFKTEVESLKCSFCGRDMNEVKTLLAGPKVFICDKCISVCNDTLSNC